MMTDVVSRASRIAAGQWGLFTTAQAERAGITRVQLSRLAYAGVLERLGRGVYVTTSTTGDEHLPLRAAWLALDPTRTAEERLSDPTTTSVVSHASAAGIHRLGDLLDDQHEFTSARRKLTTRSGILTHRGDLPTHDVTIVEGLPVTTQVRTIADLLAAGTDLEHVAQMIGQGVRRGVVDLGDLASPPARGKKSVFLGGTPWGPSAPGVGRLPPASRRKAPPAKTLSKQVALV